MLVIMRRVDEAIQIGDQISVQVVEVDGQKIRLGIVAPGDVAVRRIELESCDDCETVLITARRDPPPAE